MERFAGRGLGLPTLSAPCDRSLHLVGLHKVAAWHIKSRAVQSACGQSRRMAAGETLAQHRRLPPFWRWLGTISERLPLLPNT